MASDIILSNAQGKTVTLRNPDSNASDIVIDGSDIAKNSDLVNGLSGKADVISANDSQVKTALNASGTAPIYACRAWVNFNGTGTVAIRASGNVSSITDNAVGDFTVNFTTAMPDSNYSASGVCMRETTAAGGIIAPTELNPTSYRFTVRDVTNVTRDGNFNCINFFR